MLCLVSGQVYQHAKPTGHVLMGHVSKLDWCFCSYKNGYVSEQMCILCLVMVKCIHTPSLPGVLWDTSADLMCVTVHHTSLTLTVIFYHMSWFEMHRCHVTLSL
jgi:hypothetical protein